MSNAVLPALIGLTFPVEKTPVWSTKIQPGVSGKETRLGLWSYPIWQYSLSFDVLRSDSHLELQQLVGFFNARQGAFDSWLFDDPDDNTATAQGFGSGDGTTTAFQLARAFGGATEPVKAPKSGEQIFRNDWQGNQRLYSTARANYCPQSQTLGNASWTKTRATVTDNATVAPDGTTTADRITEDSTASNTHLVQIGLVSTSANNGITFTVSAFFKAETRSQVMLAVGGNTSLNAIFDLTGSGSVVSTAGQYGNPAPTAASIIALANGWFRASFTGTWNSANTGQGITAAASIAVAGNTTYSGDGTSSLLVWGVQYEVSANLGAYIPTVAAAVTVTDYSLNSNTGLVTCAAAPVAGAILSWTGGYYWRCRFMDDQQTVTKFGKDLWESRTLKFQSIK
jgi:hypothetical protein